MNTTHIAAFDSTLHVTNVWLHELMDLIGWQDKHRAYHALRVVLHALRDRLPVDQAAAFGAQLPMLVRGFFYEGWHPGGKPLKQRHKEEFLAQVTAELGDNPFETPEAIARAVFQVIARHVTPGEIAHLKLTLPAELRSLWAEEAQTVWF
jgi:uncharacterized protein (DUF2267 family)